MANEGWKILGVIAFLGVVVPYGCTLMNAATAPGRVVDKTLGTDNIIANYESYFQLKAGYDSRLPQIKSTLVAIATADKDEAARLRTDLMGEQQTCRDLVNRYNADTAMVNKSLFKDHNLPESLDATACDTGIPS